MFLQALQKGFEIGFTAFFALVAIALCVFVVLVVLSLVSRIFGKRDDST